MRQVDIDECIDELRRFKVRVKTLHDQTRSDQDIYAYPSETGAIKRASMDLTRALAKLRKY